MTTERSPFLGVDVGGTFTDVVLADTQGRVHTRKVLTTPEDPRAAACRGIEEILTISGTDPGQISRLVHGTTLATNVILERRGPDIAFVTTAGFGDMLRLGREARVEDDRYDLFFQQAEPPVPYERTFEADERIDSRGQVLQALDPTEVDDLARRVAATNPAGVAVCLINSYTDPSHEHLICEALRREMPTAYIAASADIWPEAREFDRAMTAIISAYVGPVMSDYLNGFESQVRGLGILCPVEIMESSGGVLRAALAAKRPVYTVESGGAAGVMAAGYVGRMLGKDAVISFDMGGTTAKAGVVRNGRPDVTNNFQLGGKGSFGSVRSGTGFPIKTPVVDLAEVGAGGGSIAWVDSGGVLRVGPQSAGSSPGPVCYGLGGEQPTVTDANLVLGYLDPGALSDDLVLNRDAAAAAIERLVAPVGLGLIDGAWAIHDLANASMSSAIRVVTIQRGVDPRGFTIVGFGGAGPLHVGRLAEEFDIETAIVPFAAGVASAIGLCTADLTVHHAMSMRYELDTDDPTLIEEAFATLERAGREDLSDALAEGEIVIDRTLDMRYRGQAYQLTVEAPDGPIGPDSVADIQQRFRDRYRQAYGIDVEGSMQVVSVRSRVSLIVDKLEMATVEAAVNEVSDALIAERPVYFPSTGMHPTPVYDWAKLGSGATFVGPALVQGLDTTVVIPVGTRVDIESHRNIVMTQPTTS